MVDERKKRGEQQIEWEQKIRDMQGTIDGLTVEKNIATREADQLKEQIRSRDKALEDSQRDFKPKGTAL